MKNVSMCSIRADGYQGTNLKTYAAGTQTTT